MREKLFIDGDWEEAARDGSLPAIDPATEQVITEISDASGVDVDRAVEAANRAFSGTWRTSTGADRSDYLLAFAREIEAKKDELARLEVIDNGKPLPEALWDVNDTIACFEHYASLAANLDKASAEAIPLPDPRFRCTVQRAPVGVAAQIIPWNYPLLMAAWKICPAIAAGCTMVLKPSEHTSLSALELGRIAQKVRLPRGVLNIVTGSGGGAGAPLVSHPRVRKIAFTGSLTTGRKIMAAAAEDIKNVSLELGGKSPLIVLDDANIDHVVEWLMFGAFWNQGQVCSATTRVLVQKSLFDQVVERLVEEARKIKIGNGLDEGVQLGPLVCASQLQKVDRAVKSGISEGAILATGGRRPVGLAGGFFFEPTVFLDAPLDSSVWNEEIFGPVVCLRAFEEESEAIEIAENSLYGLAAAVMSADVHRAERIASRLDAGIVWINCSQPTFVEAPWGGTKQSGIGRELGRWGLDAYLETKQVTTYSTEESWGWYRKSSDSS